MQRRMENNILDDSVARPTTQGLQRLAPVSTENFDYSSALRGWCNQSTVWVYTESAKFRLVSLDQTVHAILRNYKQKK